MITPETAIQVSLLVAIPVTISMIVATWRLANYMRDTLEEIRDIRKQMAGFWSVSEMERWAIQLERSNREMKIAVPDPSKIRASNAANPAS